jgi:hypothetical protein
MEPCAYKHLLDDNHGAMTAYMTARFGVAPRDAELMVAQLWDRWTAKLAAEHHVTPAYARRLLNEMLGLLAVMAREDGHGPSPEIDKALHVMYMYPEYEALCHAAFGKMIRHWPSDVRGIHDTGRAAGPGDGKCACGAGQCSMVARSVTMAALAASGPVDEELWLQPA